MNLQKLLFAYIKDVKSWVHVFGIVVKEGEDTLNWSKTRSTSEREKIQQERRYINLITNPKKEKIHYGESTTARPKERKREKSEEKSKGVVEFLIKMKLIKGKYKFSFWHCLTILT